MGTTALLIDGGIIVVYFVGITLVGLYMGRRERSLEDYALGGRRIPWWAVMASIIAAETSAATFLGAPAEGFRKRSLAYVQLTIGLILGRVLVGFVFLEPFYRYRVYTVYDYLAVRFGSATRNYVSALFLVMRVLASGVRLYVPSLVMVLAWRMFVGGEQVKFAGAATWVPYAWAIVALTLITCVYTTFGGIKAVIWTDVIQAALMFGSALVAIVTILVQIGDGNPLAGFQVLGRHVQEMTQSRGYFVTGFENLPSGASAWDIVRHVLESDYTLLSALLAATFLNMGAFGADQDMVQRLLTAPDHRRSRRSLITAALMDVPIAAAFTFIGVLLIAFYAKRPELMPAKDSDVFGAYILSAMPVVVRGLVLAGVFATAMGSLSAALNALATSATNDWYMTYLMPGRSERHYVFAARAFTALFGGLMCGVAIVFAWLNVLDPKMTIIPAALGIAGYVLGPMLGVFLLGMFTRRRGSDRGNLLAISVGLIVVFVLSGRFADSLAALGRIESLGSIATTLRDASEWWRASLVRVAFTWYAMIGSLTTLAVGLLFRTPASVVERARSETRA